ncbi:MAG: T9SS type A sorting domain-containing protein [Psychroflexus sp.]
MLKAQFVIENSTLIKVKNQTDVYTDEQLINESEIIFDVNASGGLYIDNGLDNSNGSFNLNDAILHLGSDSPRADGNQDLIFGAADQLKKVQLGKNTGTYTVTGGTLNITELLTSKSGTLEAQDRVILKSTSIQNTAIVPESTGGSINSIRVERYIPAERAYRLMASPVTTDDFIFENWQQSGLNPGDPGYRPNVGTHITGGSVTNGFDQSDSNNPSLYVFNLENYQYTAVSNTKTTKLINTEGYYFLIRGDRSINLQINDETETETVLEQTGSLHIGTKNKVYNVPSNEAFMLIGNPYQAPVDMNEVIGSAHPSFKNQIWIWVQTDFTSGQFVNISDLNNPTSSVPGSNVTEDLQPGQAAFVQSKDGITGNATLSFNEVDKVDATNLTETFSDNENSLTNNLEGFLRLGLYDVNSTPFNDVAYDGIILKFDDIYNNSVDDMDGVKLFNSEESLAVSMDEAYLSVNNRKLPSNIDEVIDLSLFNLSETEYVFSVELEGLEMLPQGIMLWDKYLNTFTTLQDLDVINFTLDASIPESMAENRFALAFNNTNLSLDESNTLQVGAYPNPLTNADLTIHFSEMMQGVETEVQIYTASGSLLRNETFTLTGNTIQLKNLNFPTGLYFVHVQQDEIKEIFKILKK